MCFIFNNKQYFASTVIENAELKIKVWPYCFVYHYVQKLTGKGTCWFCLPLTPLPPSPHPGWFHAQVLKVQASTCFSLSHSENIHLSQRGQPPDSVRGGKQEAGEEIIPSSHFHLQSDAMKL